METVNYTDFRSNLKHWLDKVVNDVSDIVIKRKGGKDLVLISLDEYNSFVHLIHGANKKSSKKFGYEYFCCKLVPNKNTKQWKTQQIP